MDEGKGIFSMNYRGFKEEKLLKAVKELEALGMKPSEIYASLDMAGVKWRSIQIKQGRKNEAHEDVDGHVFLEATKAVMQSTMVVTADLAKLGHSTEAERFMFSGIGLNLSDLFLRGPKIVRTWLLNGDVESRKAILSFAIGSCILIEPNFMDMFFERIVRFRYGSPFESDRDISDKVLTIIDRLGKAGYSILNPIEDSME